MRKIETKLLDKIRAGKVHEGYSGGYYPSLTKSQFLKLNISMDFSSYGPKVDEKDVLGTSVVTIYHWPIAIIRIDPADGCIIPVAAIGQHPWGMTTTIRSRLKMIGAWELSKASPHVSPFTLGEEAAKNTKGVQLELL